MTANLFAAMGSHHSANPGNTTWLTPPGIIDALGGADSFDLDPCAAPDPRPWPTARRHLTKADNGLTQAWDGRVWCNPPYTTGEVNRFLARLAEHGVGTALIFARTETDTFVRHVWERATGLLFLFGRLNFHLPDGQRAKKNAGAPSVLCAYGQEDAEILAASGLTGHFVPLRLPRSFLVAALDPTWAQLIADWMRRQSGPVVLSDLYRALARHPKARRNPTFQATIRRTLQEGPFRRQGRGVWEAAA